MVRLNASMNPRPSAREVVDEFRQNPALGPLRIREVAVPDAGFCEREDICRRFVRRLTYNGYWIGKRVEAMRGDEPGASHDIARADATRRITVSNAIGPAVAEGMPRCDRFEPLLQACAREVRISEIGEASAVPAAVPERTRQWICRWVRIGGVDCPTPPMGAPAPM